MFEQPDRGRAALAALGEVAHLRASGPDRFAVVADRWRSLSSAAVADPPEGPGAGPLAVGGFAFAPEGGAAPHWAGFQPASLIVPEVALTRRASRRDRGDERGEVRLTLAAMALPTIWPEELLARLERRLAELREQPLPLLDPAPTGRYQVASAMPPEHYEAAVASAVRLIERGELEKVVLAREVQVHAPGGPSMTRRRCSACCVRRSLRASCSVSDAVTRRSWPRAPSCWCVARATA